MVESVAVPKLTFPQLGQSNAHQYQGVLLSEFLPENERLADSSGGPQAVGESRASTSAIDLKLSGITKEMTKLNRRLRTSVEASDRDTGRDSQQRQASGSGYTKFAGVYRPHGGVKRYHRRKESSQLDQSDYAVDT